MSGSARPRRRAVAPGVEPRHLAHVGEQQHFLVREVVVVRRVRTHAGRAQQSDSIDGFEGLSGHERPERIEQAVRNNCGGEGLLIILGMRYSDIRSPSSNGGGHHSHAAEATQLYHCPSSARPTNSRRAKSRPPTLPTRDVSPAAAQPRPLTQASAIQGRSPTGDRQFQRASRCEVPARGAGNWAQLLMRATRPRMRPPRIANTGRRPGGTRFHPQVRAEFSAIHARAPPPRPHLFDLAAGQLDRPRSSCGYAHASSSWSGAQGIRRWLRHHGRGMGPPPVKRFSVSAVDTRNRTGSVRSDREA